MTGVRNGVMNTLGPNLSRVVRAATAAMAVIGSGTGSGDEKSRSENQTESISLFSQSSTKRQKKSRPARARRPVRPRHHADAVLDAHGGDTAVPGSVHE